MGVRRAVPVDDRALLAEFPFLPGAEGLLGELAPSVGALFRESAYDPVRSAGRARIRAAIDDPAGGAELPEVAALAPDERFLSFQFARLLLSAAPGRGPIRRWAVREAKTLDRRLSKASDPILQAVAERLDYPLEIRDREVDLDLADYLNLAVPIRESEFRLSRQAVKGGRVAVARDRAVRLLEEGVRIALTEPVDLAPATRIAIEDQEQEFLSEIQARLPMPTPAAGGSLGPVRADRFPPCIRMMRRTLEDGENLSHSGRFALAAFLHRAGASFDAIVDAYRGAPDFDESITRYQVEHITRKEEGRGYEPPDCATLRTHGLCAREGDPKSRDPAARLPEPRCFDERMRHPMMFYRDRAEPAKPPLTPPGPTAGARDRPATPG